MFSHDGLKDVLTQLAAPPLFYEELRREVSRMERNGERFAILRLELDGSFRSESDIINFSETVIRATRGEELVARLGEFEFAVLVRGNQLAAVSLLDRIAIGVRKQIPTPHFTSSQISSQAGEGALDLLNRLDTIPMKLSQGEPLIT